MNGEPGQDAAATYERLLRQAYGLIARGKGDTEEAEALADRMDPLWHRMSPAEQSHARGLAATLYALVPPCP